MPRVKVVARQGEVEEVRYRKRDDGLFYKHETEAPTDLFLVDVGGKRGSLMLPRGNANGWERDGNTHWLTNKPNTPRRAMAKKKAASKKTARRATTRRKAKRRPPHGFKTWSAYMASIRPNSSTGGTMAKRKRRGGRKATARRPKSRSRRRVVYAANPARRSHRRRYRRNPGFSVNRIIEQVKDGAIGAVAVVGGEAAARLTSRRLLGMSAGSTLDSVAQLATATALGAFGERFLGRQVARDMLIGGYAGVLRATAKQMAGITSSGGAALINEALSDDGPRLIRLGGGRRLNGYVQPVRQLNGYGARDTLAGEEREIYG